jgi:DNA-binding transcriptional MerR regulator
MSSKPPTNRGLHTGELASLAGVSPDSVRFYERRGLLPPAARSASGYRLFLPTALARIQVIRAALSIGFSVVELAGVFRERESGIAPCHRVRKLAAEKLLAVEAQLRDMQSWRDELRTILAQWNRLLAKTPRGKHAKLLEVFAATRPKIPARKSPLGVLANGNKKREKPR